MTAPSIAPRTVEADSELRQLLKDPSVSPLRRYMALVVGRDSLWALLWYELRLLLVSGLPGALGIVLRRILYRRMFHACGRGVVIGRNVVIRHPHRIHLGDHVIIDDNVVLDAKGNRDVSIHVGSNTIIGRNTILSCKQLADQSGTIELAEHVNISVNCTLISESRLTIGARVLVAGHVYIVAGGNHGIDRTDVPILDQPMVHKGGVGIEDNCWIGAHVTVLDGVTIGRDSVVAAGAVVTRPFDPFSVVGGVPAKRLRDRKEAPSGPPPG
jgi:acetyltransferase-like isoleucine patch superfamily enzyme